MTADVFKFSGPKSQRGLVLQERKVWRKFHTPYRSARCPLLMGGWRRHSLQARIRWKPFERLMDQRKRHLRAGFRGVNRLYWRARDAYLRAR